MIKTNSEDTVGSDMTHWQPWSCLYTMLRYPIVPALAHHYHYNVFLLFRDFCYKLQIEQPKIKMRHRKMFLSLKVMHQHC